jgi:hypothetical protein
MNLEITKKDISVHQQMGFEIQTFIEQFSKEYTRIMTLCIDHSKLNEKATIAAIQSSCDKCLESFNFTEKVLPKISKFIQECKMEKLYRIVNDEIMIDNNVQRVPIFSELSEQRKEEQSFVGGGSFTHKRSKLSFKSVKTK